MERKEIVIGLTVLLLFSMSFNNAFAIRLLTKEEALKEMFPKAESFAEEVVELNDDEVAAISNRLEGKLVHYQKGSESENVQEKVTYTFHYALKDGNKVGVAIIEEQPGKWGPVEFVIALDINSAKVTNMAVMSYKEKRGRPIARKNFLKQFFGKGSEDEIQVRKDIRAISGATISSDATCFAVRKVIALYEEAVLKIQVTSIE